MSRDDIKFTVQPSMASQYRGMWLIKNGERPVDNAPGGGAFRGRYFPSQEAATAALNALLGKPGKATYHIVSSSEYSRRWLLKNQYNSIPVDNAPNGIGARSRYYPSLYAAEEGLRLLLLKEKTDGTQTA